MNPNIEETQRIETHENDYTENNSLPFSRILNDTFAFFCTTSMILLFTFFIFRTIEFIFALDSIDENKKTARIVLRLINQAVLIVIAMIINTLGKFTKK
ncbi:hypothetical protein GINT2_000203 [Glugoides intestinalis]